MATSRPGPDGAKAMTSRKLPTLVTGGGTFEGPRWHDGSWWVSDFYQHHVLRVSPDGTTTTVIDVPGQPSGLGWLPDGSLVVSSMKDRKVLRYAAGQLTTYADLSAVSRGHVNDLIVDAHGHVFVGDFGYDTADPSTEAPTTLKRIDLDGSVTIAADGLSFPNGMAITPDGQTLLVGESRANRYTAFDLATDGSLSNRRVWATVGEGDIPGQTRVAVDGCTLDESGHLWVADAVGKRFVWMAPGGRIDETIVTPDGLSAFACMLGGDDGRTLLMCCAPGYGAVNSGDNAILVTTRVDIPHAGRP
jgi:sugar lactone lactonase YvrE